MWWCCCCCATLELVQTVFVLSFCSATVRRNASLSHFLVCSCFFLRFLFLCLCLYLPISRSRSRSRRFSTIAWTRIMKMLSSANVLVICYSCFQISLPISRYWFRFMDWNHSCKTKKKPTTKTKAFKNRNIVCFSDKQLMLHELAFESETKIVIVSYFFDRA